jgi:prepilin-type N-terminal cleavage/methylation domain-containing protein
MNKKPCTTPTKQNSLQQAFTLVELLIVIVAIAILAALAYAAYTAISNRALSSTLQSDLSQAAERLDIANNTLIQDVTQTQCQALPTYTGTNEDAIRSVTDNRGGTERTYHIAKLADDKCWMLDNLKLGSTTGSITLTSADSNISSNFTLPQVQTGGSSVPPRLSVTERIASSLVPV